MWRPKPHWNQPNKNPNPMPPIWRQGGVFAKDWIKKLEAAAEVRHDIQHWEVDYIEWERRGGVSIGD